MASDPGIHAHALDYLGRIKTLHLGIGIELVKVCDTDRQISIGEELDRLRFRRGSNEHRYILLGKARPLLFYACALKEEIREHLCLCLLILGRTHNDPAGVQVIVQSLGLPQELRAEDDILYSVLGLHLLRVSDRDRGLDDHQHIRVHLQYPLDGILYRRGIEKMSLIVVVGRSRYDDQLCRRISSLFIYRSMEIQDTFTGPGLSEKSFDLIILYRAYKRVELFSLSRSCGDSSHLMLLRQQNSQRKSDIPYACNRDLHTVILLIFLSGNIIS